MADMNIAEKGFLDIPVSPELDLFLEIERLKREKNAVVLAHYYQEADIQDVADYIGDSLGLAQQAEKTTADLIVFASMPNLKTPAIEMTGLTVGARDEQVIELGVEVAV